MRIDRRFLACLSVALPLVLVPFVGCSDSDDADDAAASSGEEELKGYEDVVYEGDTTDEALVSLVAAIEQGPISDPAKGATLDAPLEPVPAATPAAFTWHVGAQEGRNAAPSDRRHAAVPPASPWPEPLLLQSPKSMPRTGNVGQERSLAPSFFELALQAALSGVPSAYAHGDPFNGYGTLVTVASASDDKLARVFTGASTWTPSAAAWQKMIDAGGTLSVTLVGAEFEENRIASGAHAYTGSITTFTIEQ